ncbi:uncharacterized protein LOC121414858 [Lytechinus variegatus]|uniref:uncharacterized protein LOC121414858 n=1 Tax=Lytechinus variegatus TaxID=7654 RepID=UPI001BB25C29|nr:uncharacterized protein LOC121414858 [Lytechinus variegatus]
MSSNLRKQQEESSKALLKVFQCLRYLLRQGLPFRGHTPEEGNFVQLLKLFRESDAGLDDYLKRAINFTSPQSQEEMIQMFCHQIVRTLAEGIAKNGTFGVMVDGTQDISGAEQESICFRHVDDNLIVHEDFVGLYELPNTSGEVICSMICDVITRLSLSVDNLRAQTYDGAAIMQGQYRGCQARVKERQPLALHFHCGSHVANLIMQHAVSECSAVRDAIQWVHELGVLFKRSGKYKAIFEEIGHDSSSDDQPMKPSTIRPLCPTRWLCRLAAILSVKDNYKAVLESLREMASSGSTESAAKANGLLDRFEKGETYLSLEMVTKPIAALQQLNRSCQARSAVVSGMLRSSQQSA